MSATARRGWRGSSTEKSRNISRNSTPGAMSTWDHVGEQRVVKHYDFLEDKLL